MFTGSIRIRIVNFRCLQQNVHILITQIFLQIGKIPNNNKVTPILKLSRLEGHPVGYNYNLLDII